MFSEIMDSTDIVDMSGTSEGTQVKYYKNGYWYKEDSYGGEANSEYLVSGLLTFSDLKEKEYVLYELGEINGKSLLVGNPSINKRLPIEENVKRVVARPFSGSHSKNMDIFGKGFMLDTESVIQWLERQEDSYEKEVLRYQLAHCMAD